MYIQYIQLFSSPLDKISRTATACAPYLVSQLPKRKFPLRFDLALLPSGSRGNRGSCNRRLLANKATPFLALDAAADADVLVEDEAPDDVDPALVAGELVVELAGDLVEPGQAGPGDGGEVVVLVVEADVVGEQVEGAVVRVRLGHGQAVGRVGLGRGHGGVDVVLGDEVAGERVQAAGEEGRQEEVQQGPASQRLEDCHVEGDLGGDVGGRDPGEGDAVDAHGPHGVEEDLEGAEEGLAEDGVEEEGLEGGGQVGVEAVDAEGLVVGEVVGAEGGAVGGADGQVGDDGEEPVREGGPEGEVVADLVDREEQVLVRRRAHHVREQPVRGREEGGVA